MQNAKKTDNSTPVIAITNNPRNPPLQQWVQDSLPILHSSSRLQEILPTPPIITHRNPHSLRTILMPSRLPEPLSSDPPGCWKCLKKRCVLCREHLSPTTTLMDYKTGSTFTIRQHITCETSNLIYLIYCNRCPQIRYVGETVQSLKGRFYVHRNHISKNTGTHLTQHFHQPHHSLQDMRCFGIEIVHSTATSARLRRETFWMRKLHTKHPDGLNA